MSVGYPWIFMVPTALMIVFCVAAMVYVATRTSEHNRPKRYAITALAIMLLSQFVFPLFMNFVLYRYFGSGNVVLVSGVFNILTTGALMLAIALLVIAVFIDRKPSKGTAPRDDSGGTPLADRPNDNPYAAPRQ